MGNRPTRFNPMVSSDIKTTYIYTDGSKVGGRVGSGVVVTQADSQGRQIPVMTLFEGLGTMVLSFKPN
jgi:hypothetical protein